LFPLAALPLYWVFGRPKFEGYREAWHEQQKTLEALIAHGRSALEPFELPEFEAIGNYEALKRIARMPLVRANAARLLVDGQATFDSVIAGLARAKLYALVQFYIVRDDGLGRRLKAAMLECRQRGVEVFFLYDEIGSQGLGRTYLASLVAAGVKCSKFDSTRGRRNRFQYNFRNHRKSVVVDGVETWVGGHNVGDEYLGLDPKIGPWRDTHVHVVGPAAMLVQFAWLADWFWATRTVPEWNWEPQPDPNGADTRVMCVPLSPVDAVARGQLFHVHALNAALRRIWIATPYFIPDEALSAALRLAALRGVDVRVIFPRKTDNRLLDAAALWFVARLEGVGIRFYRHVTGFMHQKVMLVDARVSCIGSANLDTRSLHLQFEENLLIVDEAFANEMERMLLADLAASEEYDAAALKRASFPKRLGVSLARLTAPLL